MAKNGRFGPCRHRGPAPDDAPKGTKPRTSSLFKSMTLDTVSLQDALKLLTLPRVVGTDPESGDEITAQNGRYGPYLKKGTDSRSIDSEDKLLTITLEEALAIYAEPKGAQPRGGRPGSRGRHRPGERGQGHGEERPVRALRHRRRVQRHAPAGRRRVDDHDRAGREPLAERRAKGPAKKAAKKTTKKAAKKTAKKTTKKATAKTAKKS